jgi:hypothetical protein
MTEALAVYEANQDVVIYRAPEAVLAEAQKAARALADVVSKKKKPVMMNGEQYLEFEDWQTVGKFYGITARIVSTGYIEYGEAKGFEAKAVAVRADGFEVSAAESMCLNDEPNWKGKPLFQLKSMAQTRAAAKALRNVLAWVVVLAGYRPTPAEEIQGMINSNKPPVAAPQKKVDGGPDKISEAQRKRFYAIAKGTGFSDDEIKAHLLTLQIEHTADILKSQYDQLCTWAEGKSREPGDEK